MSPSYLMCICVCVYAFMYANVYALCMFESLVLVHFWVCGFQSGDSLDSDLLNYDTVDSGRRLLILPPSSRRASLCIFSIWVKYNYWLILTLAIAGFMVLKAITMKSTGFWVVTPCSSERARRFGGTYYQYLQDGRVIQARNQLSLLPASTGF
jgi:hypothetical protein